MDKKLFLISVLIVCLTLFAYYFYFAKRNSALVLVLDFGDKKSAFKLNTRERYRAWDLLQQVAAINNLNLVPDNNFWPKVIDSRPEGKDNKKWYFYVNGKRQEKSPIETVVSPPAEVAFKFE